MPNESSFQFTNPELVDLRFAKNEGFRRDERAELAISLRSVVTQIEPEGDRNEQRARVIIELQIGSEGENSPFLIQAKEGANFKWKEGEYNEEQVNALLSQNAVAVLISYLRPVIAGITSASGLPAYNLPFLDLSSMKKE